MHSILNVYYNYAVEKAGQTLLPQYLAMYKITVSKMLHLSTNCHYNITVSWRSYYIIYNALSSSFSSGRPEAYGVFIFYNIIFKIIAQLLGY